ncbi:MAG: hypothetical protein Q7W30_10475 [Coriobacteriia bacterium]|nr:hypothetical protein [Coriobacteriia bacterium]
MAKCWEQRDCDEDMQSTCPHNEPGHQCPTKCAFAQCGRPTNEITSDPALIFEPTIDRMVAKKETCKFCVFYLTNGPRIPS